MPNVTEFIIALDGKITFQLDDGTNKIVDLANLPSGGGGGSILANDITDAGTSGKDVLRAGTIAAIKAVLTLVKADVGLGNVDNTSDANKPVSTTTQAALNLKANLASPSFTGTVSGVTSVMVGLGNVDNTSDANKPVSGPQATAIALKVTRTTVAPGSTLVSVLTSGKTTDSLNGAEGINGSGGSAIIHAGAVQPFGFGGYGACTFTGDTGVTVTDIRTTGATNPVWAIQPTGANTYNIIGSKA